MDAPAVNQSSAVTVVSRNFRSAEASVDRAPLITDTATSQTKTLEDDTLTLSAESRASDSSESEEESKAPQELTAQEERQISQLAARDAEVKAHERAHKAVGGQYTGAISYTYQAGPDGKRYAVGGEVSIDTSPISGDPQATIDKMNIIKAAALAPADPSAQDRRVALSAAQAIAEARVELANQERVQSRESSPEKGGQASDTYQSIDSLASKERREAPLVDIAV